VEPLYLILNHPLSQKVLNLHSHITKYCINRYQTESSSLKCFSPSSTNITNIANITNITHIADIANIANIAAIINIVNIVNIVGIIDIVNIGDIANIVPMPNFDPLGIFNPIPPPQLPIRRRNSTRSLPPLSDARSSSSRILRHP